MGNSPQVTPPTATQAEFARLHNVSRKTVTMWKSRDYIAMVGDRVDVAASNARLSTAGRSRLDPVTQRSGTVRTIARTAARKVTGNAAWSAAIRERDAVAYPAVATLVAVINYPSDLVLALLQHLPMTAVRPLVENVIAKNRAAAVECLDEDGVPEGFSSWAKHPWFTGPGMSEAEWQELADEAG